MHRGKTILAVLFITSISISAALAQQAVYVTPGRYEIQVGLTGKVLDLRQEDKRTVQQYYRGNVKNQQWDIESAGGNSYYIRSAENGAYLGVEGSGEGARVVATNNNRRGDTWRFVDLGNNRMMIVHRSGMTLDLANGSRQDGAPIQVWSQARNENQQFSLVPTTNVEATYDPRNSNRAEYNEGYRAGANDRNLNLGNNYRRHRQLYDRSSETEFQQGYSAGYEGRRNDGWNNSDRDRMTDDERRNYDEGYRLGQQDARNRTTADYRRYNNRYNRWQESSFRQGYEAGYNNTGFNNDSFDLNRLNPNERRVYYNGYRLGQQDARARQSFDYRRYTSRYNNRQETFFQRGYQAGYNSIRR